MQAVAKYQSGNPQFKFKSIHARFKKVKYYKQLVGICRIIKYVESGGIRAQKFTMATKFMIEMFKKREIIFCQFTIKTFSAGLERKPKK
jgi:hypothetical protein